MFLYGQYHKNMGKQQKLLTFYKTLFARMGNVKAGALIDPETSEDLSNVENVLKGYDIQLRSSGGEFRNFGDVLDEVASKWSSFGSVAQHAIATAFAGTRQQEKFLVLMEGYGDAEKYAETAANSAGTATEKYGSYLSGVESKVKALTSSFQGLSSTLLNSDALGVVLDTLNGIVTASNSVVKALGPIGTGVVFAGLINFIKNFKAIQGQIAATKTLFGGIDTNSVDQVTAAMYGLDKAMRQVGLAETSLSAADKLSVQNKLEQIKQGELYTSTQIEQALATDTLNGALLEKKMVDSGLMAEGNKSIVLTKEQIAEGLGATAMTDGLTAAELANVQAVRQKIETQRLDAASMKESTSAGSVLKASFTKTIGSVGGWIAIITTAASIAISIYQNVKQHQEELRQSTIQAGEDVAKTISDLDDYKTKVEELDVKLNDVKTSTADTYDARKELMSIQDDLIEKYGIETDAINLNTESLKANIDAAAQQAAKSYVSSNESEYNKANNYLNAKTSPSLAISNNASSGFDNFLSSWAKNNKASFYFRPGEDGSDYQKLLFLPSSTIEEQIALYQNLWEQIQLVKKASTNQDDINAYTVLSNKISAAKKALEDNKTFQSDKTIVSDYAEQVAIGNYGAVYNSLKEVKKKYEDAFAKGNKEDIDQAVTDFGNAVSDSLPTINGITDKNVKAIFQSYVDDFNTINFQNSFNDALKKNVEHSVGAEHGVDIKVDADTTTLSKSIQKYEKQLTGLTNVQIKELVDSVENGTSSGGTNNQIEAMQGLKNIADQYGVSLEYLLSVTNGYSDATDNASSSTQGLANIIAQSETQIDDTKTTLEQVKDAITIATDFRSTKENIQSAIDAINELTGLKLDIDDKSLVNKLNLLQAYLNDDKQAVLENIQAFGSFSGQNLSFAGIMSGLQNLLAQLQNVTTEELRALYAAHALNNFEYVSIPADEHGVERGYWKLKDNTAATIKSQLASISSVSSGKKSSGGSGGSGGSSKSSATQTDKNLEAYKSAVAELDHELAMEQITDKQYYDSMLADFNKYLKDKTKYQDEWWSYQEKYYAWWKKQAEDAAQDRYDADKKAAEKAYDVEKDRLDKLKEANDDLLDAYKERVNYAKQQLSRSSDERSYNQEVDAANKKIADLQGQIQTLSLDDSAAANAKRLELQQDLDDELLDLDNKMYDRSVDVQDNALDDSLDAYEKYINEQNDLIDEQLKTLEEQQQAILDNLQTVLDKTLDGIKAAFDEAVGDAKTAASEIGAAFSSIQYLSGQKGSAVTTAQQQLIDAGYNVGSTGADSVWGSKTEKAYISMLQDTLIASGYNLSKYGADGKWGSETKAAVKSAYSAGDLSSDVYNALRKKYKFHTGGVVGRDITSEDAYARLTKKRSDEVDTRLLKDEVVLTKDQAISAANKVSGFSDVNVSKLMALLNNNTIAVPASILHGMKDVVRTISNTSYNNAPVVEVTNQFAGEVDAATLKKLDAWTEKFKSEIKDEIYKAPTKSLTKTGRL